MADESNFDSEYSTFVGRWRLTRPADFELCKFEDGAVLHDDLGASVIQLSPVAGEVLSLLMRHSDGADAGLLARGLLGEEFEPHDRVVVDGLLQGLKSQGLVERLAL